MIEREIDIQTHDGLMNTFITYPEEGGPFPVVLFLMDAPGMREELHDMGRRLGTVGYYVVQPNLYYRRTRQFESDFTPASRAKMVELMNSLTNALACADVQAVLDFLDGETEFARADAIGCVGYCMSGPFAFAAASAFPDRIAAAASIHGVQLCTDAPDSPHRNAAAIKGTIYFGCAELDEHVPKAEIEKLDAHLRKTGIDYRIEWYPDAHHGFVFPHRAGRYDKPSAERHWERLFALFANGQSGKAGS